MLRSFAAAVAVLSCCSCATTQPSVAGNGEAQSDPAEWASWSDANGVPLSGAVTSGADLSPASPRARTGVEADDELTFEESAAAYADLEEEEHDDERPSLEAEVSRAGAEPKATARQKGKRRRLGAGIARTAARWVGLRSLRTVSKKVPDDCSGLVRAAYGRHGVDVMNGYALRGDNAVTIIWRRAKWAGALRKRSPRPGDLVFFRETYDRNGDGRRNDGLTHIGIVEKVEKDGTVVFIHRGSKGVVRARMNTAHASKRVRADGRVYNDYLRRPDGTTAPRLTGQLFVAYASPSVYLKDPRVAQKRR